MQKIFRVGATAAAVVFMLTGAALAQTTSDAPPAPAAAPAPEPVAPAATPATPAPTAETPATPAPTAAATPADAPAKTAAGSHSKKPSHRRISRNQEIDRSIDNGTVPARYRRSVPREYQQYIPFDRR